MADKKPLVLYNGGIQEIGGEDVIPLDNIPQILTGKDADTVDGYHHDQSLLTTASPTFAGLTVSVGDVFITKLAGGGFLFTDVYGRVMQSRDLLMDNVAGRIIAEEEIKVGIGVVPEAKLHVKTTGSIPPFLVEVPDVSKISSENEEYEWRYRRPITISNFTKQNLVNYQVLISLNTRTLIGQGKMRLDCGDIRFTDSDGFTLLDYWIESGCNTGVTNIWVKVPLIRAESTKTIYLYYGNPNATTLSDDASVFGKAISFIYDRDTYYIALILAEREWVDGGRDIGLYGWYDNMEVQLPAPRAIYPAISGTPDGTIDSVFLNPNGVISLVWPNDYRHQNFLDIWTPMLAPHWDSLFIPYPDLVREEWWSWRRDGGVYEIIGSDVLGNYIAYRWAVVYAHNWEFDADFEVLLYDTGYIQFNVLRVWDEATPDEFISAGDPNVYITPDGQWNYIDLTPRWQYMESVLFVPRVYPEPGINIGDEERGRRLVESTTVFCISQTGNVGILTETPNYTCHVNGTFGFAPSSSVDPVNNGDVVFELTDDSTLTIKAKGSDGVVRSVALTLT
jgi:hypothetical protein